MTKRCAFGDPFCPCQDGLACHYVAVGSSPAWRAPDADEIAELERQYAEAMKANA